MSEYPTVTEEGIRLQKVLAQAGMGSRRACEELIEHGRVEVNGVLVTAQGMRVDPLVDVIRVDGQRVVTDVDTVVLALNKPRGVITTMSDERGRTCVGDLVRERSEHLFHVGRLDADTEGLLLLTNDGDLANRLAHPSHEISKTYLATVSGRMPATALMALKRGITLDDGAAVADSAHVVQVSGERTLVELTVHLGRNRIVRRMLDHVGYPVLDLVRTSIGPIQLGSQRPGSLRSIHGAELRSLYTHAGL